MSWGHGHVRISIPTECRPAVMALVEAHVQRRDNDIRARYQAGETAKAIGNDLGFGYAWVLARLHSLGVPVRRRGSGGRVPRVPRSNASLEIVAAYVAGGNVRAIAAKHGVSYQRVYQIVHQVGAHRDHPVARAVSARQTAARLRRTQEAAEKAERKAERSDKVRTAAAIRQRGGSWAEAAAAVSMSPMGVLKMCLRNDPSLRERSYKPRRRASFAEAAE